MDLNVLVIKPSEQADLNLALSKVEKHGFLELNDQLYTDRETLVQRLYFAIPSVFRASNSSARPRRLQMVTFYDSFISVERRAEWIKEAKRASNKDVPEETLSKR